MSIIFKIFITLRSFFVIFLFAGLTAVTTPNFRSLEFSKTYVQVLIVWVISIGFGTYVLHTLSKDVKNIWKEY